MGKCYDCNDCGTKLSSYYSHWRHRKNSCPSKTKDKVHNIQQNAALGQGLKEKMVEARLSVESEEEESDKLSDADESMKSKLSDESGDSDREVDAEEILKISKCDRCCGDTRDNEDDVSEESDDIESMNGDDSMKNTDELENSDINAEKEEEKEIKDIEGSCKHFNKMLALQRQQQQRNEDLSEIDGSNDSDEEYEPSHDMWRNLIEQERGNRKAVMQLLYTLYCFFKSSEGASYRKMIKDVEFAHKMKRLTESKSIDYALEKNKDFPVKDYNDDIKNLLDSVGIRRLVEIFYGFSSDKLMKRIDAVVKMRIGRDTRNRTLENVVEDIFKHCNDEILDKIRTEKKKMKKK